MIIIIGLQIASHREAIDGPQIAVSTHNGPNHNGQGHSEGETKFGGRDKRIIYEKWSRERRREERGDTKKDIGETIGKKT